MHLEKEKVDDDHPPTAHPGKKKTKKTPEHSAREKIPQSHSELGITLVAKEEGKRGPLGQVAAFEGPAKPLLSVRELGALCLAPFCGVVSFPPAPG